MTTIATQTGYPTRGLVHVPYTGPGPRYGTDAWRASAQDPAASRAVGEFYSKYPYLPKRSARLYRRKKSTRRVRKSVRKSSQRKRKVHTGSNGGKYVLRTSKRSGKKYKQYL